MYTEIKENERGLLTRGGRFVRVLEPGSHLYMPWLERVEKCPVTQEFLPASADAERLAACPPLSGRMTHTSVPDGHVALHYENDRFAGLLEPGFHAFWNEGATHRFDMYDVTEEPDKDALACNVLDALVPKHLYCFLVPEGYGGLLLRNGAQIDAVGSGVSYYWKAGPQMEMRLINQRMRQMIVQGQDLLTRDKAGIRVSCVCVYEGPRYDYLDASAEDIDETLRSVVQLALREYVCAHTLDEVLDAREEISESLIGYMKDSSALSSLTIHEASVRDIVLPGEIRDIMNTVLMAEKQAQANVITRREEVASTRSLLNTARLMDENATLYRLKEMEFLQKLCEDAGGISLRPGADVLEQLRALLPDRA